MGNLDTGTAGEHPPLDNPYGLFFGSDLRRWQCLLCLCPDPVSENAVSVLSYHLMLLRSAKPLERLCEKPWGDPKVKWRYDTHQDIGRALCLPLSSVKLATKYLKTAGILEVDGPHFPKGRNTRATFYRLSDQAQSALYALTEPVKNLFNGLPVNDDPASTVTLRQGYRIWDEAWAPTKGGVPTIRDEVKDWRNRTRESLVVKVCGLVEDAMNRALDILPADEPD